MFPNRKHETCFGIDWCAHVATIVPFFASVERGGPGMVRIDEGHTWGVWEGGFGEDQIRATNGCYCSYDKVGFFFGGPKWAGKRSLGVLLWRVSFALALCEMKKAKKSKSKKGRNNGHSHNAKAITMESVPYKFHLLVTSQDSGYRCLTCLCQAGPPLLRSPKQFPLPPSSERHIPL